MKALILNSGLGRRMGVLASEHPKCMSEISPKETILSRQLKQLVDAEIDEVVMTTGNFEDVLKSYCESLDLPLHIRFVRNPDYATTNYIYSIYCAREYLHDDVILMHGDLVFENEVMDKLMMHEGSCMSVSSTLPLPKKDFKAVVKDGMVLKVGIEFFTDACEAQPLYKLMRNDWEKWLAAITEFCERGERGVYAENALNTLQGACHIAALDVEDLLCAEIDNPEDHAAVSAALKKVEERIVYMCFSADILHGGHIDILRKARRLGRLYVGVLSDEAVAGYKRYPLAPASERKRLIGSINGVYRVVDQKELSYRENLIRLKPAYVVHGDDWKSGMQEPVRREVLEILNTYGGRLVEYPHAYSDVYDRMDELALLQKA